MADRPPSCRLQSFLLWQSTVIVLAHYARTARTAVRARAQLGSMPRPEEGARLLKEVGDQFRISLMAKSAAWA